MTNAGFNYFYRVDITVATFVSGASSTAVYSFTNKLLKDSTSATTYRPILKSIGENAVEAGETLPNISLSSVEIDNRIGTFGANRKFSDILQRWSPVEGSIVFYVAQVANDSDTVSSWTQIGQGVITSWEATAADAEATLRFDVRASKYAETVLTLEVARTVSGMENAPTSSLGRAVPLLLGSDLEVVPVRISADGATTGKYAWGTCFYQSLKNYSSAYQIYTKNYDDVWESITGSPLDYSTYPPSSSFTLNTYASRAFEILTNHSSIVTGVELHMQANGLASSSAYLSVFILRVNADTFAVVDEVTRGRVYLGNYDAINVSTANTNFPVNVSFDRPAVLSRTNQIRYIYYLGWEVTGYQVNDMSILSFILLAREIRKDAADATGGSANSFTEWKVVPYSPGPIPIYKFHTLDFSFDDHVNAYTQTGLTYSSMTATQFTPDSGQSNPPLDNLPLLLGSMIGLNTYGGSVVVEKPQTIAELLGYSWNGAAWTDASAWDVSTLDTTHYAFLYDGATASYRSRVARGVFDQRTTYSQLLAELCRCTASKVGVLSTGKSFMYPWGITVTPAADIPAADVTALSWEQRGAETIVNRAVIKVGRSYIYAPRSFENASAVGYRYVTDFSGDNYAQVTAMTLESRFLYGQKELAQTEFPIFPYSPDGLGSYLGSTSAEGSVLAEYYLARFGKPLTYCSFVVPYHRYSALRMFDVITFTSVDYPAYYGTDPDARDGTVDVGGAVSTVTTADYGYETVRAQTYRGLIEGISLILAMEHAPAIRLTVLVLLNRPFDPT